MSNKEFNINTRNTYKDLTNIRNLNNSQKNDLACRLKGIQNAIKDCIFQILDVNKIPPNMFSIRFSMHNDCTIYRIELYNNIKHVDYVMNFIFLDFIKTACDKTKFNLMLNKQILSIITHDRDEPIHNVLENVYYTIEY